MVEPRLTRIYYTTAQSSYLPRRSIPLSKSQHHKKWTLLRFHKGFPAKANSGNLKKFFKKRTMHPEKNSFFPLLAQSRSWNAFFFFSPYTLSKKTCMEGRRKKASHSCTGPGVGRGKCIFSGCIFRVLHKMVYLRLESYRTLH